MSEVKEKFDVDDAEDVKQLLGRFGKFTYPETQLELPLRKLVEYKDWKDASREVKLQQRPRFVPEDQWTKDPAERKAKADILQEQRLSDSKKTDDFLQNLEAAPGIAFLLPLWLAPESQQDVKRRERRRLKRSKGKEPRPKSEVAVQHEEIAGSFRESFGSVNRDEKDVEFAAYIGLTSEKGSYDDSKANSNRVGWAHSRRGLAKVLVVFLLPTMFKAFANKAKDWKKTLGPLADYVRFIIYPVADNQDRVLYKHQFTCQQTKRGRQAPMEMHGKKFILHGGGGRVRTPVRRRGKMGNQDFDHTETTTVRHKGGQVDVEGEFDDDEWKEMKTHIKESSKWPQKSNGRRPRRLKEKKENSLPTRQYLYI